MERDAWERGNRRWGGRGRETERGGIVLSMAEFLAFMENRRNTHIVGLFISRGVSLEILGGYTKKWQGGGDIANMTLSMFAVTIPA